MDVVTLVFTIVAAVAGVVAAIYGVMAWRATRDGNVLAKRADERDTARDLVNWQDHTGEDGDVRIANAGPDPALDVTLTAEYERQVVKQQLDRVDPEQELVIVIPGRGPWRESSVYDPSEMARRMNRDMEVDIRVVWRTQHGRWREESWRTG